MTWPEARASPSPPTPWRRWVSSHPLSSLCVNTIWFCVFSNTSVYLRVPRHVCICRHVSRLIHTPAGSLVASPAKPWKAQETRNLLSVSDLKKIERMKTKVTCTLTQEVAPDSHVIITLIHTPAASLRNFEEHETWNLLYFSDEEREREREKKNRTETSWSLTQEVLLIHTH